MKFSVLAFVTITAALLTACSGIVTPKAELADHDSSHSIPAIDHMIVSLKQEYINKCYMPVAKRKPTGTPCQSDLLQMLDRRYHLNYNQNHVAMAANTILFKDIDAKIEEMSRGNAQVKAAIRNSAFTSISDMQSYYKEKYQFDTDLEKY